MEAFIVLLWLFLAVMLGIWVERRGRSGFAAAILALFFSPLIIWIIHLAIGPQVPQSNEYTGPVPGEGNPDFEATRRCPACAELILAEARKCKHCGEEIQPQKNSRPAEGVW